ncbi:hypothetical protein [Paenibacillus sp. 1P03SA]|uniref:hypothetical protein n=1 Tax=Paenibacillus sp. 1P03SA TaxID=3132294 RepID=UPI0039A16DD0
MKKWFFPGVILIFILMALTVPSKQDYFDWIKDKVKEEANSVMVNIGVNLVGDSILDNSSRCTKLLVYSYCNTYISQENKVRAIGIFNTFIALE